MNILFLTLHFFEGLNERNMVTDLLREFVANGHYICAISPLERRQKKQTHIIREKGYTILRPKICNIQKTNIIEKGISTVTIEYIIIREIQKYFNDIKFDMVLYTTPPVTFYKVIQYIKKRDNAVSYLMLKDIFPQNAVDLGFFGKNSLFYKYFRAKEKKLYAISDYIGCTSPENIRFTLNNNKEIGSSKVEICVNCMEPYGVLPDQNEIDRIRCQYNLPVDKKIFLYGGNLGIPQGVDFLMKCLEATAEMDNTFFLIIGAGTQRDELAEFIQKKAFANVKLMDFLPKEEFDRIAGCCDVGMIFLNIKSTTPNTPCRLLSYTNAAIPVLAVTDRCTDIGQIITEGKFGWYCYSDDVVTYKNLVAEIATIEDFTELKKNAHDYLLSNYTAKDAYKGIMKHFGEK